MCVIPDEIDLEVWSVCPV